VKECLAWIKSQSLGSRPTCDLVINLVLGCHYLSPSLQLLSQPKSITAPCPVSNYTAWRQRDTGVGSWPSPARTRTCDL